MATGHTDEYPIVDPTDEEKPQRVPSPSAVDGPIWKYPQKKIGQAGSSPTGRPTAEGKPIGRKPARRKPSKNRGRQRGTSNRTRSTSQRRDTDGQLSVSRQVRSPRRNDVKLAVDSHPEVPQGDPRDGVGLAWRIYRHWDFKKLISAVVLIVVTGFVLFALIWGGSRLLGNPGRYAKRHPITTVSGGGLTALLGIGAKAAVAKRRGDRVRYQRGRDGS